MDEEKKSEEFSEEADLTEQIADLNDRLLRAVAESENIRKRGAKEREEARKYSITSFARDVLSIRDNLKLALECCNADGGSTASDSVKAIVAGIEMTLTEMDRILDKYGVSSIEANNRSFDPHFHQAMFEVYDNSVAPGTVVKTVQDGFMIDGRLLRPAMVGVATGTKPGNDVEPEAKQD
jgi:molecular chaperone GrpE